MISPPSLAFFAAAPDMTPFEVERIARPMPSRTAGISATDTYLRRPGFEMRLISVMAGTTLSEYLSVITIFFGNSEVTTNEFPKQLVITLKYTEKAVPAITELKRISKPGLRKYVAVSEIPAVLDGMGLAVLSTSKGVMSGAEAKKAKLGGEIICTVA